MHYTTLAHYKVLTNIQEELQQLETERTELQLHIEQTDSWTENLGVWQCRVHQAGDCHRLRMKLILHLIFENLIIFWGLLFFLKLKTRRGVVSKDRVKGSG